MTLTPQEQEVMDSVEDDGCDGKDCGTPEHILAPLVRRLLEREKALREALRVAKESYKRFLAREGYEWEGPDCDLIDATLSALNPGEKK